MVSPARVKLRVKLLNYFSMTQSKTYLDRYDADSLPDYDECVIESGEQIRFTAKGRLRFGGRFGKSGIDILTIKTKVQFKQALEQSFHVEMAAFVDHLGNSGGNVLEKALLAAIALGDTDEAERLSKVLERRNQLGLKTL
jgi:hypothetical protein